MFTPDYRVYIWLKNWNERLQWKENYIQAYGAAVHFLKFLVKMIQMRIQNIFITKCETCSSQVECDQEIDEEWKEALILCILCNFLFPNCKWSGGWSLEIATSYFLSKPQIMFAFCMPWPKARCWPTIDLYQENSRWKKWISWSIFQRYFFNFHSFWEGCKIFKKSPSLDLTD